VIHFGIRLKLTEFDSRAFVHSSLQSIAIPDHVKTIGESCFRSCKSFAIISLESDSELTRFSEHFYLVRH
jgi:hypothetical protein